MALNTIVFPLNFPTETPTQNFTVIARKLKKKIYPKKFDS
jgi:hypothetical protein